MDSGESTRKTYLRYRAEDFPLFVLSLLLTGALIAPVLEHPALQALLGCSLVYLAWLFVLKHGAKMRGAGLDTVLPAMARYPVLLVQSWWATRGRVLRIVGIFAAALLLEYLLRPALAGTKWLEPFPWRWAVWVSFGLITALRLAILIAHLLHACRVREILESSPIKSTIEGASIRNHIVHAFVTGLLAHLCLVAPCVLFYMYTNPTNLREVLLIAGFLLANVGMFALRIPVLELHERDRYGLFYQAHSLAHESRFFFTVFHAHHHDAIPSGMIGAGGGTGFLENADRTLCWLDPLRSIMVTQIEWLLWNTVDILGHQYIPGVFPFTRQVTSSQVHHVSHHLGSLRPLGIVTERYSEAGDIDNGYRTDSARVRWFLDTVERYEGLDPKVREAFLLTGNKS